MQFYDVDECVSDDHDHNQEIDYFYHPPKFSYAPL